MFDWAVWTVGLLGVAVASVAVWVALVYRRHDTTRSRRMLRAAGLLIGFALTTPAAGLVASGSVARGLAGLGAVAAGVGVVTAAAAVAVAHRELAYTRWALQQPVPAVHRLQQMWEASGPTAGGCRELTCDDLGAVEPVFAAAFASPVAGYVTADSLARLVRRGPGRWWGLVTDGRSAALVAAASRPRRAAMLATSAVAVVVVAGWWLAAGRWGLAACVGGPLVVIAVVVRAAEGRPLLEAAANLRFARQVDWVNVQLAVAPERQGGGLGGRLLAEADRRLADRGQTALIVARPGADGWYRQRAIPVAGWPHLFTIGRPLA